MYYFVTEKHKALRQYQCKVYGMVFAINISLPAVMFDMCGVCIVRTYYMIRVCTTWLQRSTRRFGDTSARFGVWYLRTYHTHLPGSYRSRSDIVDMRWNPDIPLGFARVGFFIHFGFLLVSVGHHDAFVRYRVVIDRACTRTLSHSSPTPLETTFNQHTYALGASFFHQLCGAQLMLLSPSGSAYLCGGRLS